MSLTSIFNKRANNRPAAHHPLPAANAVEPPATAHPEPPLMVLTSDAAGPSVRRLHHFPDAEAAAAHIQFWFPVSERSSVIAFWALTEEPATAEAAGENNGEVESACAMADSAPPIEVEAVVLIRHQNQGSVYPFSFVDMETANRFIRQEAKRGLDLRSVLVFWGAFVRIDSAPNGEVTITPAAPPATRAEPDARPEPEEPGEEPATAHRDDPLASYTPPSEPTTLNDIIRDLARTLNVSANPRRRAFTGFGSPRGRF
jgi:hypothetical protein